MDNSVLLILLFVSNILKIGYYITKQGCDINFTPPEDELLSDVGTDFFPYDVIPIFLTL